MQTLDVSISAVNAFMDCEGRYFYSRIQDLTKRDKSVAPTMGIIIHEYFHRFWRFRIKSNPRRIKDSMECHEVALYLTLRNWRKRLTEYGNFCWICNEHEDAEKFFAMPKLVARILNRYYLARGQYDAELYRPLYIEHPVKTLIYEDDKLRINSRGIVDLVTLNLETGMLGTWEHKSVINRPPSDDIRFRDIQTLMYGLQLAKNEQIKIGEVVWNYLLQKDPAGLLDPDALFNKPNKKFPLGAPSRDKGIDTNWPVWSHRMTERGYDPNSPEYADIKERVTPAELTRFFPRQYRETLINKRFMVGNYINVSKRIARTRDEWASGEEPLWHFQNHDCKFCEFFRLCHTRLKGDDVEDTKRTYFEQRPKPEADRVLEREGMSA